MTSLEQPPSHARAWGLLLVISATAAWSTAGVWVKIIMEGSGISAIDLAFWRDLVTFLLILAGLLLLKRGWLRVRRRDLPWLGLMGAVGIGLFHALWNRSVQYNGAAIATVLQYNAPIIVAIVALLLWAESLTWQKLTAIVATTEVPLAGILAYLLLGERLSGIQWVGVFLVMFGVALVSSPGRWTALLRATGLAARGVQR